MEAVVIDSCCLINLYATGKLGQLLETVGWSWKLPEVVAREALYLRVKDAEGNPGREAIDLTPFVSTRLLQTAAPQTETEFAAYVDLAVAVDDGKAMALALAVCRGWRLATDDAKALRTAEQKGVKCVTTPEIIRQWAEATAAPTGEVAAMLMAIQERARFAPPRSHPLGRWWARSLEGIEG